MLSLVRKYQPVFQSGRSSASNEWEVLSHIFSPAIDVVSVLDFSHARPPVVASRCCLKLRFPDDNSCWACFHMLIKERPLLKDLQAPYLNWTGFPVLGSLTVWSKCLEVERREFLNGSFLLQNFKMAENSTDIFTKWITGRWQYPCWQRAYSLHNYLKWNCFAFQIILFKNFYVKTMAFQWLLPHVFKNSASCLTVLYPLIKEHWTVARTTS